jgi:RecA-superfamily ATPases implicated in signal transduction
MDNMLAGGIPRGFFVAVVGEPGTGKTVFALHFAWEGVKEGDKVIYVTTEESRESVIRQAKMFGMRLGEAVDEGKVIIIDALLKSQGDEWSLEEIDVETLVNKVIEAKRKLGYGRSRLIIDSMSTFWLDKPALARKYSYAVKRVLYRWDFTVLMTSQYAITTSSAFGWGLEHVADGIIRFGRRIVSGELKRYVLIEKMRQTPHDLKVHYIDIVDGRGLVILEPAEISRED